jgi:predicted dehydrogenase
MGRTWLDVVARRDDVRVAAIVDVFIDAAKAAALDKGLDVPVFSTLEEALAAVQADLVLNVTIPEAHAAVDTVALRAGVPVLSEKPLTPTVAEALALAALSEVTGTLLATSQSRRYSPGIATFRDALQSNGGAEHLATQFFVGPRFGGFREEMAHPLLEDMAIHTFDQARYLLDAEPTSVYCRESNPSWSWYQGAANADAIFSFDNGAVLASTGSWCADGLSTSWNGSWRGSFANGSASWDGGDTVELQRRDEAVTAVPLTETLRELDASLDEFLLALDGGPTPWGEVHRNVWSVAMVEGAIESARRDAPVRFAEFFAEAHAAALATAEPDVAAALRGWASPIPLSEDRATAARS